MQSSFSARWSVHLIQSFVLHCKCTSFSASLLQPRYPLYAPLKSWSLTQISQSLFGWGISSLPAVQYPEQGPNLLPELTSSRPLGTCKSHHRDYMIFLVLFYSENPTAQGYHIMAVSFLCKKHKSQKLKTWEIKNNPNYDCWRGFNLYFWDKLLILLEA